MIYPVNAIIYNFMGKIKSFSGFNAVTESKTDGNSLLGIYGPNDYDDFIKTNPQRTWGNLERRFWEMYVKPGSVFVTFRTYVMVGAVVDKDGKGIAYDEFDRQVKESVVRDAIGSRMEEVKILAELSLDPLIPVHDTAEMLLKSGTNIAGVNGLFDIAVRIMANGETPVRLLSILRRLYPEDYDKIIGGGGMAADMGDLGF
jgi:hypothetical protein